MMGPLGLMGGSGWGVVAAVGVLGREAMEEEEEVRRGARPWRGEEAALEAADDS